MFMYSEDWDGYALFEHRARISGNVCQKVPIGRLEVVPTPCIVVIWQDVCMCNLSVEERSQVYYPVPQKVPDSKAVGSCLVQPPRS